MKAQKMDLFTRYDIIAAMIAPIPIPDPTDDDVLMVIPRLFRVVEGL